MAKPSATVLVQYLALCFRRQKKYASGIYIAHHTSLQKQEPPNNQPSTMTTRTSSTAGIDDDERQLKMQRVWNVVPSELSMLTANPIRKIVDNIKKPENSDKALIPLSLGVTSQS
jgi:hypothetical protein